MKYLLLIAVVCSIALSSSAFDGRQSFFRHRVDPIERRSSLGMQDVTRQWLKRYYHNGNGELAKAPQYEINSPEDLRWLVENVVDMEQNNRAGPIAYPAELAKRDDDVEEIPYDSNDDVDYNDLYNLATLLNGRIPLEPTFQAALREYLSQQDGQVDSNDLGTAHEAETSVDKKGIVVSSPGNKPITTSAPVEAVSKTTDSTMAPTESSNSLSVMPPVHTGKGQKEFPMLRPASENGRKFDTWTPNFQNTLIHTGSNFGIPRFLSQKKDSHNDDLTEELNKLKQRSRRSVKEPVPVFF